MKFGSGGSPIQSQVGVDYACASEVGGSEYNGPQNLGRVICYTWERKRGGPCGEFKEPLQTFWIHLGILAFYEIISIRQTNIFTSFTIFGLKEFDS